MSRVFADPLLFDKHTFPVIVLCDDLRSFVGWGIKAHTSGNYNHSMIMHKREFVVSQDFGGFNEKSISKYLTSNQMLKFWRVKDLTEIERVFIEAAINRRLALPWWRRSYDFLGTFIGQGLNIRWLQNPWREYCSEQVKHDYIDQISRLEGVKFGRPSPSDLDRVFKQYPDLFTCIGYWWSE